MYVEIPLGSMSILLTDKKWNFFSMVGTSGSVAASRRAALRAAFVLYLIFRQHVKVGVANNFRNSKHYYVRFIRSFNEALRDTLHLPSFHLYLL